jgi:uncharacterized cupin superfamily protein
MAKYIRMDSATAVPSKGREPSPNVPIHSDAMAFDRWQEGVRFAGGDVPLGDLGGCQRIGFSLTELTPGKQSCPAHWHMLEEEHFFILEGRCVLRSGDARYEMGPGDYVCFPAGTRVGHCFENPFAEPCRLISVGDRNPNEVCVYPDSGKMKIRSLGVMVPIAEDKGLDYWHGERPEEALPTRGKMEEPEPDPFGVGAGQ